MEQLHFQISQGWRSCRLCSSVSTAFGGVTGVQQTEIQGFCAGKGLGVDNGMGQGVGNGWDREWKMGWDRDSELGRDPGLGRDPELGRDSELGKLWVQVWDGPGNG